ncbi:MAG: hypothetical protein M3Z85_04285 [Acidobacteriota bacterium]|nr:hypothetical protein [Acidobacteriota bacterium]
MAKRINVVLSESTLSALDRLATKGKRSRPIDKAVQHYVATRSAEGIREQLTAASIRDRDLDSAVAVDWAAVDKESWQHIEERPENNYRSHLGPIAENSISRRSTRR